MQGIFIYIAHFITWKLNVKVDTTTTTHPHTITNLKPEKTETFSVYF